MSKRRSSYRICPLCEACCGLDITIEDGRVTAIRGAESDPFSQGFICPKGVALKDLHDDPDRLRTPMIKRDGRFEPASWEAAFAEIDRRLPPILAAHGRNAAGLYIGNPSAHKMGILLYISHLGRALGSANVFSASTLDQMPRQLCSGLMYGHWLSVPVPDIERTDHLIVIGANPMASNGSMWTVPDFRGKARALRARGGRLIVIDPRRTETAAIADRHHFIRPGGDVHLLLAMIQTLLAEGRVDPGAASTHIAGLDAVTAAVAAFTPERAAPLCGIAADDIRALARDFAAAPRAALYGRMGTNVQAYGTVCAWAIDLLNILTGRLDTAGGVMFPKAPAFAANTVGKPGIGRGISVGRRHSRVSKLPEVFGEFPAGALAEEIDTPGDGQIRALITVAGNPVLSAPNGERLSRALGGLDFMVSLDVYINETTRHADVILPGPSPLEDSHYDVPFPQLSYRNQARFSPAVLPRTPGQPAEWQTILKLAAIAAGQGADADPDAIDDDLIAKQVVAVAGSMTEPALAVLNRRRGAERLVDFALRTGPYGDMFGRNPDGLNLDKLEATPGGIDLGPLTPRLPEVLRTPTGKIDLAPDMILADLARAAAEVAAAPSSMLLIGRRDLRSNNSWMHNLPILAKGPDRCTAIVHPADAARHGLRAGGRVRIARGNKAIEAPVEIDDAVMEGVICLPHGWGHNLPGAQLALAAKRPGANYNALVDEDWRDPLSGNSVLNGIPVTIAAAG